MIPDIKELLKGLIEITAVEREAKATREAIEIQIYELYKESLPAEGGAKTFEVDGVKFEVKTGYRFSADVEAIKGLPFGEKLLRTKVEFSDSQYKKLWEMNKDEAEQASQFVTATPSKPAVKVKEVVNG
jgi:hypothetical protein